MFYAVASIATLLLAYLMREPLLKAETRILADVPARVVVASAWTVIAFPMLCAAAGALSVTSRQLRRPWFELTAIGLLPALAQVAILLSRHRPLDGGLYRRESAEHREARLSDVGDALGAGVAGSVGAVMLCLLLFLALRWAWRRLHGRKAKFYDSLSGIDLRVRRWLAVAVMVSAVAGLAIVLPMY